MNSPEQASRGEEERREHAAEPAGADTEMEQILAGIRASHHESVEAAPLPNNFFFELVKNSEVTIDSFAEKAADALDTQGTFLDTQGNSYDRSMIIEPIMLALREKTTDHIDAKLGACGGLKDALELLIHDSEIPKPEGFFYTDYGSLEDFDHFVRTVCRHIEMHGKITSSDGTETFNQDEMRALLAEVQENPENLYKIPRTDGLRDAVSEYLVVPERIKKTFFSNMDTEIPHGVFMERVKMVVARKNGLWNSARDRIITEEMMTDAFQNAVGQQNTSYITSTGGLRDAWKKVLDYNRIPYDLDKAA